MSTLRQAVERLRADSKLPLDTPISVMDLHRQFPSNPRNSVRALMLSMLGTVSQKLPWAVILCRFRNAPPRPAVEGPVEQFYREIFTPGTGGLIEYWRDASLGAIDITGSRVFDWVEVEIERSQAGGSDVTNPKGPGRSGLVDMATRAVQARGEDPFTGFHSQIAVYTENWSRDGITQTGDFATWGPFWIDGSADVRGKVTLTPEHAGDVVAHEMGHGFGMKHDVSADFQTHYADPCCIMSQAPLFRHPRWNRNFGPAVCLPHLFQRDWMYNYRVLRDDGAWMKEPAGITVSLAVNTDVGARAHLGLSLAFEKKQGDSWDYLVEYKRPANWDRGLTGDFVFVRRIGPGKGIGPTPAILLSIPVPPMGARSLVVEESGPVSFSVERFDDAGRIAMVTATFVHV